MLWVTYLQYILQTPSVESQRIETSLVERLKHQWEEMLPDMYQLSVHLKIEQSNINIKSQTTQKWSVNENKNQLN